MTIFSCLVLYGVLRYSIKMLNLDKFTYDVQTVTAADYTVEVQFTKQQCDQALSQTPEEQATGLRLKRKLT